MAFFGLQSNVTDFYYCFISQLEFWWMTALFRGRINKLKDW